jgi:glycosyltransferase involved in cell wall biosynthesis
MIISVITINWNGGDAVERTIASVLSQKYAGIQWVIIDGGSTDGSGLRLAATARPDDVVVIEPDHGIADAMNKGLARSRGEAVIFMNAGDEFAGPSALADLVAVWDRTRHRWIVGSGDVVDEAGTVLFRRGYSKVPEDPLALVRRNCRIMHQSVLAERSLFTELGPFDQSFRISMDYELWIRWMTKGIFPQMTSHLVCRFHRGGASGNPMRNHQENRRARELHGIGNGVAGEFLLALLAWTKGRIRGRYGLFVYRLKERLGIRI